MHRHSFTRRAAALAAALSGLVVAPAGHANEEVPFITSPDNVTLAMLEIAGVRRGEHVIDLGSGDGRIVITAARRFGATGLGVEIDPALVERSRAHAKTAGVAAQTRFLEQDLFTTDLSGAQVITMYLLPAVNLQLRPRLLALRPGTRIVSHDWTMGDWQPDRSRTLDVPDKAIGRDKRSTVHLWVVPAQVAGQWCGPDASLTVTQRFQRFSATLARPGLPAPMLVFDGHVAADRLHSDGDMGAAPQELQATPDGLRFERATGVSAVFTGQTFLRAGPRGC